MGLFESIFGTDSCQNNQFEIGDKVRVKYRGQEGYIIDKNGDIYMVSINDGAYIDSYSSEQLEKCW